MTLKQIFINTNMQNQRFLFNISWYALTRVDDDKIVEKYAETHQRWLHHHFNVKAIQRLNHTNMVRRLKRTKQLELV